MNGSFINMNKLMLIVVSILVLIGVVAYAPKAEAADTKDVIAGVIIGGIIGNNIPGEDGGGALGAIVGGALNAESNTGPQCRTETRYEEEITTILINWVHSKIQISLVSAPYL